MYHIKIDLSDEELRAIEAAFFMQLTKEEFQSIKPYLIDIWRRIERAKDEGVEMLAKANLLSCLSIGTSYTLEALQSIYESKFREPISIDTIRDIVDKIHKDGLLDIRTDKEHGMLVGIKENIEHEEEKKT